jgi:hypothetical protein
MPMSPATRPPTHVPPVPATSSQSAVDQPSTPRRSTRTVTPSSKGLEFIADRAGSASPTKAKRPPDSEPESCSEAETAGGGLVRLALGGAHAKGNKRQRRRQHTTTATTTRPSK